MTPRREAHAAYAAALRVFVADGSETALRDAYEVGRRAVERGLGVLDMLQVHLAAVEELLAAPAAPGAESGVALWRSTCAFLAESLSPFEMTHRGFREAHQVLKRSETRYRSLVDNAPLGIARCTSKGELTNANPALVEMLGFETEQALLDAREQLATPRQTIGQLLASRDASVVESVWRRRDGTPITVRVTGRPIFDADGAADAIEIMCEDVTQRRELEAQLRHAQKIEAIGRLAGGVAHDFNNFITGILMCSHILRRSLHPDDPRRKQVGEIEYVASRASLLTQQLLTFSRRQPVSRSVLDLNRVVRDMAKLLAPLVGTEVDLVLELNRQSCTVRADELQLEQVVMNLAINARDAMPGGGRLIIGTEATALEPPEAKRLGVTPGRFIRLCVRDTGIGMDEATRARLFEPFFTTKPAGKGTGLGLATCYAIVTQAGGAITVASAPGAGTSVTIYLPEAERTAAAPRPSEPDVRWAAGHETILLAEDDPVVRVAAEHTLREAGYTVLGAATGAEAIRLAERDAPVHLVLADVGIPGGGGRAIADQVRALHPSARVLYVSGYAADDAAERGVSVDRATFLPKPFTPDTLIARVREVLDRDTGPE